MLTLDKLTVRVLFIFIFFAKGRMVLKIKHSTSPNYKEAPKKTENYNQALNGHLPRWTPTTAGAAKPGESHLAAEEL